MNLLVSIPMPSGEHPSAGLAALVLLVVLIVMAVGYVSRAAPRGRFTISNTRAVRAAADGVKYRVHPGHDDAGAAAETMAELNRRSVELMRYLRDKYLRRPGSSPARARAVRRLLGLYNPDNLAENSPRDPEGDTSYTVDKGAILALCLREKDPGRTGGAGVHDIHDLNTLTFVTLHELTHIAIEDTGHPPQFWQTFKFILRDAVSGAGLLAGVDYSRHPTVYCGMSIDYNPLYDDSLPALV